MNTPQDGPIRPQSQGASGDGLLERVLELIRFLRANCAWDAAQTPRSLLPYLLEETHEVVEAVYRDDEDELSAELGDLLLHVGFQMVLAEERTAFAAAAVVDRLEDKMRRRHPHLYGAGAAGAERHPGAPEPGAWERLKARERDADSILAGLTPGLDPLSRAHRIQERVSAVGFDWADARGAFEKVAEEVEEVRRALAAEPSPALEEELGDLLFAVVNLARLAGSHAMHALGNANRKFSARFAALERLAAEREVALGSASLEQLDALWDEVKRAEG